MAIPSTTRSHRWSVLLRSASFWIGAFLVLMWVFFAIVGDVVTPYDPLGSPTDVLNRFQPPSAEHWFGTDQLGRDVQSRVLAGARQVLMVALSATIIGTVAGTFIGLVVGYLGGIVDDLVSRILDAFPPAQQAQIRATVSESLRGIVCQRLLPAVDGGSALACELLVSNLAVANLVRDNKLHQLKTVLETGQREGMTTMDNSIVSLFKAGRITREIAIASLTDRNYRRQIDAAA